MRALRVTAYMSPDHEPLTVVTIEPSLKVPPEDVVAAMLEPGVLLIHDIFDVPNSPDDVDAAAVLATTEAMRRMDEDAERNMAVMYFWDAAALRVATAAVFPTKPAPLTVEQITTVFEQLATHPAYEGQHVHAFTEEGHRVNLKNGHVTDLPPE